MKTKLFNIFILAILSGCTVIGSQPILSFDSIESDNIVIFLKDSKNAILIDAEKEKIAAIYEIPVNKEINSCYALDSHYDFYVAGNNLYFTSENSHENIKNAQRVFHINPKNGEYKQYPCLKVQAVDTTAAGDTLCGGLAARLAAGESLENAALFGSKAASIACTRKGAQPSIPTVMEVEKFKI